MGKYKSENMGNLPHLITVYLKCIKSLLQVLEDIVCSYYMWFFYSVTNK